MGIVDGAALLDLEYREDSSAEVDFNVIGTDAGTYVELQGTAEGKPFDRAQMDTLLDLADGGLKTLFEHPGRRPQGRGGQVGRMSRRLLLATRARHKVAELQELLDLDDVMLVTPDEVGIEGEPVEDAATFEGNAEIKARYYAERSGLPTLADDSGLEVDALDGRPGVYTRRYAGDDPTDEENNQQAARRARRAAAGAARRALPVRAGLHRPRPATASRSCAPAPSRVASRPGRGGAVASATTPSSSPSRRRPERVQWGR